MQPTKSQLLARRHLRNYSKTAVIIIENHTNSKRLKLFLEVQTYTLFFMTLHTQLNIKELFKQPDPGNKKDVATLASHLIFFPFFLISLHHLRPG